MKKLVVLFGIISSLLLGVSNTNGQVGVGVSISVAPPPLPVYVQPPCPADGYLWVPGYWAYGPDGYYWVPGVWVYPPAIDLLWTPGYWGFVDGYYAWHRGYWGPHVGFYGGVCYGFGYTGEGFYGGRWERGAFRYNTAVSNINRSAVHNTYIDRAAVNTRVVNHTSFNGPGGVTARPTATEQVAMRENHTQPTSAQRSHEQIASRNRNQRASVNKGKPTTTGMSKINGQRFNTQGRVIHSAPKHAPAIHNNTPHAINHPVLQQHKNVPQHNNIPNRSMPQHNNIPSRSMPQHNNIPNRNVPQRHGNFQQGTMPAPRIIPRVGGRPGR